MVARAARRRGQTQNTEHSQTGCHHKIVANQCLHLGGLLSSICCWCCDISYQLYRMSQARISPSRDSQYGSATSSEYDMIITSETQFQELPDDPTIPYHSLRLQPLAELTKILASQQEQQGRMYHQHMQQQSNLTIPVDVIGIITEYGPQISWYQ